MEERIAKYWHNGDSLRTQLSVDGQITRDFTEPINQDWPFWTQLIAMAGRGYQVQPQNFYFGIKIEDKRRNK